MQARLSELCDSREDNGFHVAVRRAMTCRAGSRAFLKVSLGRDPHRSVLNPHKQTSPPLSPTQPSARLPIACCSFGSEQQQSHACHALRRLGRDPLPEGLACPDTGV
jgi:hypothetical protein